MTRTRRKKPLFEPGLVPPPGALLEWRDSQHFDHAVILSHPHPDHPCGCEWENTWRLIYAPPTEPGAIPITVMRHPAAQATAADMPSPDHGSVPATWAH